MAKNEKNEILLKKCLIFIKHYDIIINGFVTEARMLAPNTFLATNKAAVDVIGYIDIEGTLLHPSIDF